MNNFTQSCWFQRGWTLQELMIPGSITFYNRDWIEIGTKSSLITDISKVTGIAIEFLKYPHKASVAQKMSWGFHRQTTRKEDEVYCLLGLFDVIMPLLYGESSKAFSRLQEVFIKISADQSIFAWENDDRDQSWSGMLAESPVDYAASGKIVAG